MKVDLEKDQIKNYRHGKILLKVYDFEVRWYDPEAIDQPYKVKRAEVDYYVKQIKKDNQIPAVIVLTQEGIVAGFHVEAFKQLKYQRIPILWGKYKK